MFASICLYCAADGLFSELNHCGLYSSRRTLNGYRRLAPDKYPTWIAKISIEKGKKVRNKFLSGNVDYSNADKRGNEGVYRWYCLPPGLYEVHERVSWKHIDHRFIIVTDMGKIKEATMEEICHQQKNI